MMMSPQIALNEQFMVASLPKPSASSHSTASKVTRTHQKKASSGSGDIEEREEANVVLRTIRDYMGSHKTFGENLIFILNRCSQSCFEWRSARIAAQYADLAGLFLRALHRRNRRRSLRVPSHPQDPVPALHLSRHQRVLLHE